MFALDLQYKAGKKTPLRYQRESAEPPKSEKVLPKVDLTVFSTWINIAIKYHIAEVQYENHPDDP